METAGKLVEDEEAQEAMRGSGLGTAATRTQTIKKLLDDGYLVRKGRELHASPTAMALKKLLEKLRLEVLTSPEMTGKWEARLGAIEAGSSGMDAFTSDIRALAEELTRRAVSAPADLVLDELPHIRLPGTNQPFRELLHDYETTDGSVRIPKIIRGRHLHPDELQTLLKNGVVGPLDGFFSPKKRKTYPACIRWIADTNRYDVFYDDHTAPPSEEDPQIGVCRHCGGTVHEQPSRYVCVNAAGDNPTCGFALRKLWCSRTVTKVEVVELITDGRTKVLEGFRSKKNRPFKATITVGPEGKPAFEFPKRGK